MSTETPVKKDRAASLAARSQEKFDELFKGRHYKIVKVIKLEGEQRFQTPFGNKGRNGFALIPDDRSFASDKEAKAAAIFVGETVLRKAAAQYGAVEVPVKERKRRTSEEVAAAKVVKDAERAEKKAKREEAAEAKRVAKSALASAVLKDADDLLGDTEIGHSSVTDDADGSRVPPTAAPVEDDILA
jgi:hypothetical protein